MQHLDLGIILIVGGLVTNGARPSAGAVLATQSRLSPSGYS